MNKNEFDKMDENWKQRFRDLQQKSAPESEQDKFILDLAKTLQEPEAPPLLWAKIENKLRNEKQQNQKQIWRPSLYLRVAAMVILVVGAGFFWQKYTANEPSGKGVLNQTALQKVISTEKAYETAISELEKQATPKMQKMDIELLFLYRDKLATIDEQIAECRQALKENPGNAHIRRYMLAALRDKKETLTEILQGTI